MAKSPNAFRTISEVSDDIGVPQHVLRFWETKFTQVKPMKRGGGRRYYRPEDVDLLRAINSLLYSDGLTIKGVQKLLRERGAKAVAAGDVGVGTVPGDDAAPIPRSETDEARSAAAEGGLPFSVPPARADGGDADMLSELRAIRTRLSSALDAARSV
ncbi:MerR family transcriptional regulator [Pacificimonas flava]|uniref:Transcriptional regulator, MerR family n=1 Tax=Pacificimonas flava TaxID=1234595 RepID=M2TL85_9SPHN|nr:MerR family transcriptional regulator [Pacificimonas flava]EMD82416.1 Transcriptional regulator, MerR family [Pacificimonas flava]MBB5281250.1 DNA-binding transcriptional MerR regulator [Pacificimonas flava]